MIDPKSLTSCGGCGGDVKSIGETIKQASRFLIGGHQGIAEMYRSLALRSVSEADRTLYKDEATKHDRMAAETADMVVPDDEEVLRDTDDRKSGGEGRRLDG